MKAHAVASLKAEFPLTVLLPIAGMPASTFHYHQARFDRPDKDADLKTAITAVFEKHHGRYGHRRVHAVLLRQGWQVAKKTVLKLMRAIGLTCKVRARRRYVSWAGETGRIAKNILDRDFTADAPQQKWVTDVTEFRVGTRKVYLSPVMDLFDRSVVAYSWSTSPGLALTNSSLEKALMTLDAGQTPLVHTDYAEVFVKPRNPLRPAVGFVS